MRVCHKRWLMARSTLAMRAWHKWRLMAICDAGKRGKHKRTLMTACDMRPCCWQGDTPTCALYARA